MGEVYRARDTRLGREVAIKVLSAAVATDPDRLRRFEHEAKAASSLNHPHILTVFDVGTHQGAPYLVTELLEGDTLRAVLDRPLASERALDYGTQIVRGLAAAHEKGIVHRDLKPENLFVTRDGRLKILDFGLARLVHAGPESEGFTEAPTATQMTRAGVVMGTVGYMSPEQVRGEPIDPRSDVFAFGCVLYEMLSGRRAFERDTAAETMTAILKEEPEPLTLACPDAPAIVGRLLDRCLAKPREERPGSGRELVFALEVAGLSVAAARPAQVTASLRGRRVRAAQVLGWIIAGALGAALAAIALLTLAPRGGAPARRPPMVSSVVLPSGAGSLFWWNSTADVALSPDGSRLAYAGPGQDRKPALWLRDLGSPSVRELPGTSGAAGPFWSPDGRSLGFFAAGQLKKVPIDGGPIQTLADAMAVSTHGGAWNRDGVILFSKEGAIAQVPAAGGTPQIVVPSSEGDIDLRFPSFLPNGRRFLYFVRRVEGPHHVSVGSLDPSEPPKVVHEGGSRAEFSPTGHLLFVRDGMLLAQPFDDRSLRPLGDPEPIASRVGTHTAGAATFSVSARGTLAYGEAAHTLSELVWRNRQGAVVGRLTELGRYIGAALHPDGRHVAVEIEENETNLHVVWVVDPVRGIRSRLSRPPQDSHHPVWSPDGRELAFSSTRSGGKWLAYRQHADGLGEAVPFRGEDAVVWAAPRQWLRPEEVLVEGRTSKDEQHLFLYPASEARSPRRLVEGVQGALSPDGRWLAVAALEAGRYQVFVLPFPELQTRWQVSQDGGNWPRWRRDGGELFFVSEDRMLRSVRIGGGDGFAAAAPVPLFPLRTGNTGLTYPAEYDVSADGERFVVCQVPEHAPATAITIITDWEGLLRHP